jgi:hypothetical protein
VPLSGFFNLPAVSALDRVPRPYFMPQPFLDCLPSEFSPHEDRDSLSRPLAPLQLSTILQNALPATLLPEVSSTPTLLTQLPDSPPCYELPFHESEGPLPSCPGSPTEGSSLPAGFTCFEAFFPPRVRSHWPEQARTLVADTLLSLCPSKDLTAQTLESLTRLNPCESKHLLSPGESSNATSGTNPPPLIG